MPRFLYNLGRRVLFCFGPAANRGIYGFLGLKKPKSFRSRAKHLLPFFFFEHPHADPNIFFFFHCALAVCSSFTTAAPWRRWFCGRRYCVIPPAPLLRCSASTATAPFRQRHCCAISPAPLRCHFTATRDQSPVSVFHGPVSCCGSSRRSMGLWGMCWGFVWTFGELIFCLCFFLDAG